MYQRILALLQQNRLSARKLEIQLKFAKGTIGRMKDHSPSIEKVAKVAAYFNVTMEYLYYGTDITTERDEKDPMIRKNKEDTLAILDSFTDIRDQSIFVGRISIIAEQMLSERSYENVNAQFIK
ncbi:XRE family transcriptional regulator [Eubacterium sp. AM05-23]|uniref:helix-turn-helix domain-containing protein n=1 Tax=Eubacterium TaxID=1730 RepID=UPI000E51F517|nr:MULTISPECIES: helix-turn-helix transcriptional regulator [Eubacterium]RHO56662.1 XRE family transcriptional regulator [Eubacterium sp. AM05-23]